MPFVVFWGGSLTGADRKHSILVKTFEKKTNKVTFSLHILSHQTPDDANNYIPATKSKDKYKKLTLK